MKMRKFINAIEILLSYEEDIYFISGDSGILVIAGIDPEYVSQEHIDDLNTLGIGILTKTVLESYYIYEEMESAFCFFAVR